MCACVRACVPILHQSTEHNHSRVRREARHTPSLPNSLPPPSTVLQPAPAGFPATQCHPIGFKNPNPKPSWWLALATARPEPAAATATAKNHHHRMHHHHRDQKHHTAASNTSSHHDACPGTPQWSGPACCIKALSTIILTCKPCHHTLKTPVAPPPGGRGPLRQPGLAAARLLPPQPRLPGRGGGGGMKGMHGASQTGPPTEVATTSPTHSCYGSRPYSGTKLL